MRKLRLELDALRVETFDTMSPGGARGTVNGRVYSEPGNTCADSCNECHPNYTPGNSDPYSCADFSCVYSCANYPCQETDSCVPTMCPETAC